MAELKHQIIVFYLWHDVDKICLHIKLSLVQIINMSHN
jgi:hypothetical protein